MLRISGGYLSRHATQSSYKVALLVAIGIPLIIRLIGARVATVFH
jgi:hypothetical protein